MERAAAYYRMRGDVGPLQVETLRFLQDAVDAAYAGSRQPRPTPAVFSRGCRERRRSATRVDSASPTERSGSMFDAYGIPYGPGANVTINNRDYETSESGQ